MKRMYEINRIAAWALVPLFFLFMLTGLDSQRRLLAPMLSSLLHFKYLFLPAQLAFVIHSGYVLQTRIARRANHVLVRHALVPLWVGANLALVLWFFTAYV